MMARPLASICIPSYNHAPFLPAAIASALAQTYRPIEVVIIDDGSTDGSLTIAQEYAARHPSLIRVITHPGHQNRGISATVNLGLDAARGEYWSGLASDDELYPYKIEEQARILERDSSVGFVYGSAHVVAPEGRHRMWRTDLWRAPDPVERLVMVNCVIGMTVLARRQCMLRNGPHDERLIYSDWEFWVRLFARFRAAYLDRPLIRYRMHAANTSIGGGSAERELRRALAVMEVLAEKASGVGGALARPRTRALIELQRTYFHYCLGESDRAMITLGAALAMDASLGDDDAYLAGWLHQVARLPQHWDGGGVNDREFGPWVLEELARMGSPTRLPRARAEIDVQRRCHEVLDALARGERLRGWASALACVARDPRCLGPGAFRAALLEAGLGRGLAAGVRRLLRRALTESASPAA